MLLIAFLGAALILYLIFKGDRADAGNSVQAAASELDTQLEARNREWALFIAGYYDTAKTKTEKKLIERMLSDIAARGLSVPIVGDMEAKAATLSANSQAIAAERAALAGVDSPAYITDSVMPFAESPDMPAKPSVEIDNATLLLYFGAFLFVASVGLFVAFGGLPGTLRAMAVAFVAIVMYASGIWLFRNRAKLEQAGIAFASIGLATAPFVGLAFYNFVFDKTAGSLVWFATSIVCLGLYLHALLVLKKPLLNYILIFTMLSLIESGISIINVPLYYFGWGLAATGLLLTVLSHYKVFDEQFQEASTTSAKIFMPLASASAVLMVGSQGVLQLGVSLALAAIFYVTEFLYSHPEYRVENALASQVAALGALGAFTYGMVSDISAVAVALLLANGLQVAALIARSGKSQLWKNFASVTAVSSILTVILSGNNAILLALSTVMLVANSLSIWFEQHRDDVYVLAVIAWMFLPLVIGQEVLKPALSDALQTWALVVALLVQGALLAGVYARRVKGLASYGGIAYLISVVCVLVIGLSISPLQCLFVSVVVALSLAALAEVEHDKKWATLAGFAISVPVLRAVDQHGLLLGALALALVANIGLALRYRQEATRWLGTGLWLLVPLCMGNGTLGHWTPAEYAWAYIVIMIGLVFARAIARGRIFVSSNVPLASYARSASLSYVAGYTLAAVNALGTSLASDSSRIHTSLILVVLGAFVVWLALKVERQQSLLTLMPIIAQAVLLSIIRPGIDSRSFDWYLLASTLIAGLGYVSLMSGESITRKYQEAVVAVREGSLAMAALTPLSLMFAARTHVMMPIGLLVFSGLLYHRARTTGQSNREWIGGLGLISIWWLMWFCGVRNTQAYTHVLAALFAAYAYWRHVRGESATSDQYLIAMLATATVPLILQALGGTAGDLYGWWLLLEQVFFMILGMFIGKPLVTRWGLYVAVGAVLYQLRHLGWAALTVLAIFIIGLAVYRLQKQDDKK